MLALHGFDVVGLEVSRVAVKTAQAYAAGEMAEPRTYNYGNRDDPAVREPGRVTFVERDFFDKGWEAALLDGAEGFDLIYYYTVCRKAKGPHRRITSPLTQFHV